MASYYLGVDGGQSSTTALIGDETGRVLGAGRGGPCNHVGGAEGRTKFIAAIRGCVGEALSQAGLPMELRFTAGCLGFSGGPADKDAIVAEILSIDKRMVTTDARIALTGATAGGPGIITIGGTGSISFGRSAEGKIARVGGWGYVFGDEGGAFDISRQAVRAALRMEEGWGPPTVLHAKLLEITAAHDANEVMHRFYTTEWPRPRVASVSRIVDEAAGAGDKIAEDILNVAAQQLAAITAACRRLLFQPADHVFVARIGGVFKSARLLERFLFLVELDGHTTLGEPRLNPAAGALLEAYQACGLSLTLQDVPELK